MLKNILNLKGAQQLTKSEQKNISGGRMDVNFHIPTCLCGDIVIPVDLCDVCTNN